MSLPDPTNSRNIDMDSFLELVDDRIGALQPQIAEVDRRLYCLNLEAIARNLGVTIGEVEVVFSKEEVIAY